MDNQLKITDVRPAPRFRGQVLNRVYRVWLFRRLAPILTFEIIALTALLYGLGRVVFVRSVIENGVNVFFTNPAGIVSFATSAFWQAGVVTKIITLALAVALAFLIRHLTQGALRFVLVRQNYFSRVVTGE